MSSDYADQSLHQGKLSNDDLVRFVIRERLATREEISRCEEIWKQQTPGAQRTLLAILLAEQALTPNQSRRLLREASRANNQIPGYQLLERVEIGRASCRERV